MRWWWPHDLHWVHWYIREINPPPHDFPLCKIPALRILPVKIHHLHPHTNIKLYKHHTKMQHGHHMIWQGAQTKLSKFHLKNHWLQTAAFKISHHHTIDIIPFPATVMDCIAEIGMDPQGVQKCVAVSVIFQIISIMKKLRQRSARILDPGNSRRESAWFFLARPQEMIFWSLDLVSKYESNKTESRSRLEIREWSYDNLDLVSPGESKKNNSQSRLEKLHLLLRVRVRF